MKNQILVLIGAMIVFGCNKPDVIRELPSSTSKASAVSNFFPKKPNIPDHEKGVIRFKLKDNNSLKWIAGRSTVKHIRTKAMEKTGDNGFFRIYTGNEEQTLQALRNNPIVEWAEYNDIVTTQGIPDDIYWNNGSLYGMSAIKADVAWASGNRGSKQVYVGVIDEGIFSHDDLCGNIWKNPYELDNGIDDDGNGYIDDFNGWDWHGGDNQVYPGAWHGTHVAGTIGAKGGNQIGVVGVSPNVTMISCKFLEGSGYTEHAIMALDYLIDLKTRHGINIKLTSNSWGGGGYSQAFVEALTRAENADILCVFAAGNAGTNNDLQPQYPANYPNANIISVGASDGGNNRAGFSCYGRTTVDIFASGVGVVSTVPTDQHTSGYAYANGTSMATPHVTGAAALYFAINPDASWQQCKAAILNAATPLPQLQGLCVTNGLLNVSTFTGFTPEIQEPIYPCPPITPDNNPPSTPTFDIYDVGFDPNPGAFYGGYFGARWTQSIDPEGGAVTYVLWMNGTAYWSLYGLNFAFAGLDTTQPIVAWVHAQDSWGNVSAISNKDTADWGTFTPPPPPTCTITSNNLNATSQSLTVTLSWTINTSGCTVSSTRLERKKSNGTFAPVAFNPSSPYIDNVPTPGQYVYRLSISSSTGQTFYSNEKSLQVKKK